MGNMILPGTYIDVRAEGLIAPGQITVGNLGVIGTAAKGPVGVPVILGSFTDAKQKFYTYDAWIDGKSNELTLVRALEQAFEHGATTVFAVRVAGGSKKDAAYTVTSASGNCASLTAKTEGTWGNDLTINIAPADDNAVISGEVHLGNEAPPITLDHIPVVKSARNRILLHFDATGVTQSLQILYGGGLPDDDAGAPGAGQVKVNRATGALTFGDAVAAADKVNASYLVDKSKAVKVTLQLDQAKEAYLVVDGNSLVSAVNDADSGSKWVTGKALANAAELPNVSSPAGSQANFKGGDNGAIASAADYQTGLDAILNEEAHIIVAAGQDDVSFGAKLDAHCQAASTDTIQHERIGVIGSRMSATVDDLRGHNLDSDRIIFTAPGIQSTDAASGAEVTLPGAYTAAAVAGLLSSFPAHFSLTNKELPVDGLQQIYTRPELEQLVEARVLALERRSGFKIVKGITTTTDSAFSQITTRRIVDFAKFGVRSAADPFIGLLNNDRVRGALRASINGFLAQMVESEMLVTYDLSVSATRQEQIEGIARVTMTLQPTFSIDFIVVTMFLQ
jgi:hypothetical protein